MADRTNAMMRSNVCVHFILKQLVLGFCLRARARSSGYSLLGPWPLLPFARVWFNVPRTVRASHCSSLCLFCRFSNCFMLAILVNGRISPSNGLWQWQWQWRRRECVFVARCSALLIIITIIRSYGRMLSTRCSLFDFLWIFFFLLRSPLFSLCLSIQSSSAASCVCFVDLIIIFLSYSIRSKRKWAAAWRQDLDEIKMKLNSADGQRREDECSVYESIQILSLSVSNAV